jgi:hypothetical protein
MRDYDDKKNEEWLILLISPETLKQPTLIPRSQHQHISLINEKIKRFFPELPLVVWLCHTKQTSFNALSSSRDFSHLSRYTVLKKECWVTFVPNLGILRDPAVPHPGPAWPRGVGVRERCPFGKNLIHCATLMQQPSCMYYFCVWGGGGVIVAIRKEVYF